MVPRTTGPNDRPGTFSNSATVQPRLLAVRLEYSPRGWSEGKKFGRWFSRSIKQPVSGVEQGRDRQGVVTPEQRLTFPNRDYSFVSSALEKGVLVAQLGAMLHSNALPT